MFEEKVPGTLNDAGRGGSPEGFGNRNLKIEGIDDCVFCLLDDSSKHHFIIAQTWLGRSMTPA